MYQRFKNGLNEKDSSESSHIPFGPSSLSKGQRSRWNNPGAISPFFLLLQGKVTMNIGNSLRAIPLHEGRPPMDKLGRQSSYRNRNSLQSYPTLYSNERIFSAAFNNGLMSFRNYLVSNYVLDRQSDPQNQGSRIPLKHIEFNIFSIRS